MIAFRCELPEGGTIEQLAAGLREDGFVRAIVDGRIGRIWMRGRPSTARCSADTPRIAYAGHPHGAHRRDLR